MAKRNINQIKLKTTVEDFRKELFGIEVANGGNTSDMYQSSGEESKVEETQTSQQKAPSLSRGRGGPKSNGGATELKAIENAVITEEDNEHIEEQSDGDQQKLEKDIINLVQQSKIQMI